ncbi:cytochrome c biogenesis protein DipZ [Kutzneria kofuensis]|uniref:Cytochrome c biogenesis protein CcdA/thiol-disulfide isomerase/thioredoxin n=1 Tax=Kutzneria kofuensis TaxID=103725 RepID=A0A7W9NES7_9PSEU|nr:cytochrome c biogenesis protein DipZ [Kutzneria kofuensis]MBB5889461.1 cytochrome c biogenesis protein CcdA/thiol-disulfide isomerase/thioredoxin [Kutzneria kofuensis]
MVTLVVVGFLAGVITSLSPCVLPVLPIVLTSGGPQHRKWRPYLVIAGLVLSFALSTLFGSLVLTALGLPQTLLRDAGIAVLALIGVGLVWPRFGDLLERPFARLGGRPVNPDGNGIVLGLGLGLLFVPCAGPVLATIAVIGANHTFSAGALALTAAFAIGCGVPLLVLAVAGDALSRRLSAIRTRARGFRVTSGVVMLVVAAAIALNLTDGLQSAVPGYTSALQQSVESNSEAQGELHGLSGSGDAAPSSPGVSCQPGGATLRDCGKAPEFTGITDWINSSPLTLAGLRGKVVLIDFWTYSCINCQRTLPHVESWYQAYHQAGLEIIGVHTPEFAFEHDVANIRAQAQSLGVRYPVAVDNGYSTWNAYSNQYWPAEYLIDAAGNLRHVNFGEGDYSGTEQLIRQLLTSASSTVDLPAATDVADTTPAEQQTPETYLGSQYAPLHVTGKTPSGSNNQLFQFPSALQPDTFALAGAWQGQAESLTSGPGAQLELSYQARDVYLVLGGSGTVTVQVDGKATQTVAVSGVPKLYTLVDNGPYQRSTLTLGFTPGIDAYDFTFG